MVQEVNLRTNATGAAFPAMEKGEPALNCTISAARAASATALSAYPQAEGTLARTPAVALLADAIVEVRDDLRWPLQSKVRQSVGQKRMHQRQQKLRKDRDRKSWQSFADANPKNQTKEPITFFAELYEVLQQLSPERRRDAIARELSELQRRGLEDWILWSRDKNMNASEASAFRGDIRKEQDKRNAEGMWFDRRCTKEEKQKAARVVTYAQRSRVTGRTSTWYYSVVCLPGLHVVGRMRRDLEAATRDSQALTQAKRSVSLSIRPFDEAVRNAFSHLCTSKGKKRTFAEAESQECDGSSDLSFRRRLPRVGSVHSEPENLFLRFYAAVEVAGGGFSCLLRSPSIRDLETALKARSRLFGVLNIEGGRRKSRLSSSTSPFGDSCWNSSWLNSLSHNECIAVLERLRLEHQALHQEEDPVSPASAVAAAARNFKRVAKAVMDRREARSRGRLQRLLKKGSALRLSESKSSASRRFLKDPKGSSGGAHDTGIGDVNHAACNGDNSNSSNDNSNNNNNNCNCNFHSDQLCA
eukprot:TRINITY_DN12992_c0_g1_i1.p1 TRINITY_DN12992_c0_g1~~TRINITY_DN12992_c0_g1_i1.p1  ORF type:complete len:547 (-),score=98.14 TRINITY_DN12992_c0_g1_i1:105-1691(-)